MFSKHIKPINTIQEKENPDNLDDYLYLSKIFPFSYKEGNVFHTKVQLQLTEDSKMKTF